MDQTPYTTEELIKLGKRMMRPLAEQDAYKELTNEELGTLFDIILELWPTE